MCRSAPQGGEESAEEHHFREDEEEYMLAIDEYGEDQFTAMIGAEAIYEMLASMNLEKIAGDLLASIFSTTRSASS